MGMRTFQTRQAPNPSSNQAYDTTRPLATYGRHSTVEQKGNIATSQQTVGLERLAVRLGFNRDLLKHFYEDLNGVSAYKLPLDQRKSMSDLYDAIVRGEIGTVLCYMVDRMFRTRNGVEYEQFMNKCAEHNVKVITAAHPMRIYDLNLDSDRDEFRRKCEEARRYVDEIIKGRLNAARDELGHMGQWGGWSVPIGYIVDFDESSPTYKKYIEYKPHADVVRAIFTRFEELNGEFHRLGYELERSQPVFPPFENGVRGVTSLRMNREKTGYVLGRDGLRSILTNPAYIGMFVYQGTIIEDNHKALIDKELFMYAFDAISHYTLEGERKDEARKTPIQYTNSEKYALLQGKIQSNGAKVYTLHRNGQYAIESSKYNYCKYAAAIPIKELDAIFSERLIWMLKKWHIKEMQNKALQGNTPYSAFTAIRDEKETVFSSVEDFIPQVESNIRILRRNLKLDVDEETAKQWAAELKRETAELTRLQNKLADMKSSPNTVEEAKTLFERVSSDFRGMHYNKKLRAINLAVDYVNIEQVTTHFLRMEIQWAMPTNEKEVAYIYRRVGANSEWSDEDNDTLRKSYTLPYEQLMQALPARSYISIRRQANKLGLPPRKHFRIEQPIEQNLTYEDVQLMKQYDIKDLPTDKTMKAYWQPVTNCETYTFVELFSNNAQSFSRK